MGTTRSSDYLAGGAGGAKGYEFSSSGSGPGVANMFAPSSFTLGFGTNNTERMRISSAGDVGIGTIPTVGYNLDVKRTSPGYSIVGRHATGGKVGIYNSTGDNGIGTVNNYAFNLFTNNSAPQVTIATTGKVGIGTTSPDSKLDVKGPSATPADGNQTLSITNTTGGTQLNLGTAENSYGWIEAREGATLRNLLLQPNGGNVGIGTTSPSSILELEATTPILTLNSTAVNVAQGIEWKNSGTLDAYIKQGPSTAEFEFNVGRNTTWGGDFKFVTDTYDAYRIDRQNHRWYILGSQKMCINSLGNVGINTTIPGDKLEIGNIPFISHNPKPTRAEALEYYRRVTSHWKLSLNLYEAIENVGTNPTCFLSLIHI